MSQAVFWFSTAYVVAISLFADAGTVPPSCSPELGLRYIPVLYDESAASDYPFHAWFEYNLPSGTDMQFLNLHLTNPENGISDWLGVNIPLPPALDGSLPVRTKLDLVSICDSLLPETVIAIASVGEYILDPIPTTDSCVLVAEPEIYDVGEGSALSWHPTIPYFPPVIPPFIPPGLIRSAYRGCEVPNVDLDSTKYPINPDNPQAADINACGPAAAANSLTWLDQQHDEITIPGNIRSTLDSLKKFMKLDPVGGGVLWEDLIKGKLEFIDKYKLPIHVKFQSHISDPEIASPDSTYLHVAHNETVDGNHPDFNWFADEMDAGEDVEVLFGYYCDTIIYDTTIVTEIVNGEIVEYSVVTQTTKKVRKSGHYINMTGYMDLGNGLKWVSFKHDPRQEVPEGPMEEFSPWIIDSAGYAIIQSQSQGDCTAYVETVTSESFDPTVEFCPIVRNTDNDGFGSLRWAMDVVDPGGKIKIHPLLDGQDIVLTDPIVLDKDVTIMSPVDVTVNGSLTDRPFEVEPGVEVTIDHVDIVGGTETEGNAIQSEGTLTLRDCDVHRGPLGPSDVRLILLEGGELIIEGTSNLERDD